MPNLPLECLSEIFQYECLGKSVDAVYFDFSQTFDKGSHLRHTLGWGCEMSKEGLRCIREKVVRKEVMVRTKLGMGCLAW